MRRALLLLIAVLLAAGTSHSETAKRSRIDVQRLPSSPRVESAPQGGTGVLQAPAVTLQTWTFDTAGAPDPQGWTVIDRTVQPAHFHVEDFVGMMPPIAPLSGTKSLWLGQLACAPATDCPLHTNGYGDDWEQYFLSQYFPVTGDVTITFQLKFDCEPTYDELTLYYGDSNNVPHEIRVWSGTGTEMVTETIPAANHGGLIAFMFAFKSDNGFSDEDGNFDSAGAAMIDNIVISTPGNPLVDSQTFEDAADGATSTPDFSWFANGPAEIFGNYSYLFSGEDVLQEDPDYVNLTRVWGFFSGSTDNYACGAHPEQPVVPMTRNVNGIVRGLHNELQSPPVSLALIPANHAAVLSFDVYEDLTLDALVFYSYGVRSKVGGVWKPWKRSGTVYYNPEKVWNTRTFNLNSFILPGATDIQLAIFVRDLCPLVCGSWGSGACHSHGPLIDNVRLIDGNTPPGYFVDVVPVDPFTGTSPVSLEFFQVTGSGETSLHMSTGGPVPNGFAIGDGTYYNISTTATVTGGIDVCITYNEAALTVPEASLQMMHWDEQLNPDSWVNITTTLDVVNNKICGWTENLSPFVIAKLGPTPVDGTPSPQAFALRQNVPNPFNPTTTITYDVPAGGAKVSIRVYDAAGRLVRALVEEQRPAGTHATTWDGRDQFGSQVSSGVYFYRMTAGSFVESRRMVLLK